MMLFSTSPSRGALVGVPPNTTATVMMVVGRGMSAIVRRMRRSGDGFWRMGEILVAVVGVLFLHRGVIIKIVRCSFHSFFLRVPFSCRFGGAAIVQNTPNHRVFFLIPFLF